MKTISDHIDYVKGQPHHVRKRVAFGAAAGVSTLIALVWLVGGVATGSFAIQGSTFATATQANAVATTSAFDNRGLAGAAAGVQDADAPAHIEIVDTGVSASAKKQSDQTILPF